jgi:hypothetical protein
MLQMAGAKLGPRGHFEQLLADWVVACDQPFDEVEKPEFRRLLEYTHLAAITSYSSPWRHLKTHHEDG